MLFVGSLIPRKGLPFLVEAAKKIVKEKVNTNFLVVGDGPLRNQLIDSLRAANLLGNFLFMGNLKDDMLPAVYGCADVFVLPSIQEGQGIVLLEAQASGKPVVAFDITSNLEIIRQLTDKTGFLIPLPDINKFSEQLKILAQDAALRIKLGINGRKRVEEKFQLNRIVKDIEAYLFE